VKALTPALSHWERAKGFVDCPQNAIQNIEDVVVPGP